SPTTAVRRQRVSGDLICKDIAVLPFLWPPRQLCRSAGIGSGTLYAVAPAPTPPSQVFGGVVVTPRVDGRSAAQNMKPSDPGAGRSVRSQSVVAVRSRSINQRAPAATSMVSRAAGLAPVAS